MEKLGGIRLVAVTGCDSGIGAALVSQYLERGFTVVSGHYGTLPAPLSARHRPLPLDLTSEASIVAFAMAVRSIVADGASLYALVSNAGTVVAGPVENIPLEALREVFEVNFFGAYSLVQKLIPEVIGCRARIALVGSLAGLVAMPLFSPYVSSKFALEGFADSLRRELAPFGVRTILFEPAAVATPIWNESWERIRERYLPLVDERYRAAFEDLARRFVSGGNEGMPSEAAAFRIASAIDSRKPRARYIVSKSPVVSALEAILPDRLLDWLIARVFGLDRLMAGRME